TILTERVDYYHDLQSFPTRRSSDLQKYNCILRRLDYQQEEGLMSSLPLGVGHVPIKRALTTTSTAIFVPFTSQELFMEGESLYRSEEHTSELQSRFDIVCRLLLEKI